MNEYRHRDTGTIVQDNDFRALFPDTAWPSTIDAASLDSVGYEPIGTGEKPVPTAYQRCKIVGVVKAEDGSWVYAWALEDFSDDEKTNTRQVKQDAVWELIKAERDRRKFSGLQLLVGNEHYWFWTDQDSRGQYSLLDSKVRRTEGIPSDTVLAQWKTMSGAFVPFTVELLYRVMDGGIEQELMIFQRAEWHRQAMIALDDPNTYDYRGGWPETYEEWAAIKPEVVPTA